MALQFSLSPSPPSFLSSSPSPSLHQPVTSCLNRSISTSTGSIRRISKRGPVRCCLARPSLDTTSVPTVGQVTEVNKDTFWPLVKGAGSKVVVLDMYTQWCGPCKVIAPKFQKLSEKYQDVVFMKLDCNQENKALAKELGIKVVPTFKILKDSKVVKEVTGAKFDDLVFAIDTVKSSS